MGLEKSVEKYLVDEVHKLSGDCFKWVSPGNTGATDRIVMLNEQVWFIETKRSKDAKIRAKQMLMKKLLVEKHKLNHRFCNSKKEVDKLLLDIMES